MKEAERPHSALLHETEEIATAGRRTVADL